MPRDKRDQIQFSYRDDNDEEQVRVIILNDDGQTVGDLQLTAEFFEFPSIVQQMIKAAHDLPFSTLIGQYGGDLYQALKARQPSMTH